METIHLPILRAGQPYYSLTVEEVAQIDTGAPVARVSQANRGLIARDLALESQQRSEVLQSMNETDLIQICARAAVLFGEAELPLGESTQSPTDFVRQQSATTGMPQSLCRQNMKKIRRMLENMESVLDGLTRGLDLKALDAGFVQQEGRMLSFQRQARELGAILPSNSPGVHSLWIPALALKVPVILKPGSQEPWTPFRIAQALMKAGLPPPACNFYPTDYSGATEVLLRCDRSLLFGDESTVGPWRSDTRIQIHGPGWSKVVLGPDQSVNWERYIDLIVTSVVENGGRSCINASSVWTIGQGESLARAVAARLVEIEARPLDDPQAGLCAFAKPEMAYRVSETIDRQLEQGGATDLTRELRQSDRVVEKGGLTFLLPTLIWCRDPQHPLAQAEYLFPFVSVVEVSSTEELLSHLGPTLVATLLTEDPALAQRLLAARSVERINLGAIPTSRVAWDQPHEGNLFDLLYRQRAFQLQQTIQPVPGTAHPTGLN